MRNKKTQRKPYVAPALRILRVVTAAVALVIIAAVVMSSLKTAPAPTIVTPDPQLLNVRLPEGTPEQIKEYTGFTVSFNATKHVPNYVAWELTADETTGENARKSQFAPDPDIEGCATLADYNKSGFDRGHMAPAGDMKWSRRAMADSHYLTNVVPQDHRLNAGRWNTLEQKCRIMANRDSSLIIIAGPILTDRITRTIGSSGVAVPERLFKVIFAPKANPPRAIAFVMPNRTVRTPLGALAMSVDRLEEITGMDFFYALPDDLEDRVERSYNLGDWGL